MFAKRINIPASETLAMNARANEKRRAGEVVHNLSVGEPSISMSERVLDAVNRALQTGKTHYPPVAGIVELRDAAANWMNRLYGCAYAREHTLVTSGGKFGLYLLLQSLLNESDNVLVVAPYWVSYPSMVQLAGGTTTIVQTTEQTGWKVSPSAIEAACTDATKILIINNASNPTGVLYSREEMDAIIAVARKKNLFVISDEVYSTLVYDDQSFVSAGSHAEAYEKIIVIQSASKNFAMTGLRVGFVFGSPEIISVLEKMQGQSTSGAASICQWAAFAAIEESDAISLHIRSTMQSRRDVFVETWKETFGASITVPQSALYAFMPLANLGIFDEHSTDACMRILEEGNVALVPGAPFGAEGYVRCSFGDTEENIREAIRALHIYLKSRTIDVE